MPVICNSCGGSFEGVGPGPEWGHDSLACSREAPQRQRERIAELEAALRALRDDLPDDICQIVKAAGRRYQALEASILRTNAVLGDKSN